jgi:hypothetical protein
VGPALGLEIATEELREVTVGEKDWAEIRFAVAGGRDQIRSLVRLLENIPYASRITTVGMRSTTDGSWQANITIQIQILSYAQ